MLKGSLLHSQWWNPSEINTHPNFYGFMGIFSDTQGQLTPQSVVELGRNSNSPEISWLSSEEDPIKNEGARVLTRFFPL